MISRSWLVGIVAFWVSSLAFDKELVDCILIGLGVAVIYALLETLIKLIYRVYREITEAEELPAPRRPRNPPDWPTGVPEPPRRRRVVQDVEVLSIQLIVRRLDRQLRVGRLINVQKDDYFIPIAMVGVNDDKWTQPRKWPQERPFVFLIKTPRGRIYTEESVVPSFRLGENRLYPKDSISVRKSNSRRTLQTGRWTIQIVVGSKIVAEETFFVTENEKSAIASAIGTDMEITPEARRLAEELPGPSPSEIEDILM